MNYYGTLQPFHRTSCDQWTLDKDHFDDENMTIHSEIIADIDYEIITAPVDDIILE